MWWIVAAVVLGGTAIAMQAPVNAALARELGGPVPAAAVSFGVGFLVLLLITLHGTYFYDFAATALALGNGDVAEFTITVDSDNCAGAPTRPPQTLSWDQQPSTPLSQLSRS